MVAIDIETTGLDPKKDAIIEIGAMQFDVKRILGKWTKLINPGRPIPPEITQLTGITNEMVRNSPPIKEVLPEFIEFAGEEPVLGTTWISTWLFCNVLASSNSTKSLTHMNWHRFYCPPSHVIRWLRLVFPW